MIDALELSVPALTPRQHATWANVPEKKIIPANPYTYRADFRLKKGGPGLLTIVHYDPVVGANHYKVQFTETSKLTVDDFFYQLHQLFVHSYQEMLELRVMRVDFAADVLGVPVQWFRENCDVPLKHYYCEIRKKEECKSGAFSTLMIGKRPDWYRIYDKVSDVKHKTGKFLHMGLFTGKPEPTITRVERQCSGAGVPEQFKTLRGLLAGASEFDPFDTLEFLERGVMPDCEKWNAHHWLMCLGLKAAVDQRGRTMVRKRLNRDEHNKSARYFRQYSDPLRPLAPNLTLQKLNELYRRSTILQFNQPKQGKRPRGGTLLYL